MWHTVRKRLARTTFCGTNGQVPWADTDAGSVELQKTRVLGSVGSIASKRFDTSGCVMHQSIAFDKSLDKFGGQKCRCSASAPTGQAKGKISQNVGPGECLHDSGR